jgi:hypothetical protein
VTGPHGVGLCALGGEDAVEVPAGEGPVPGEGGMGAVADDELVGVAVVGGGARLAGSEDEPAGVDERSPRRRAGGLHGVVVGVVPCLGTATTYTSGTEATDDRSDAAAAWTPVPVPSLVLAL